MGSRAAQLFFCSHIFAVHRRGRWTRQVPASVCKRNWVNAPCVVAEVKLVPATPRLVSRVVAPRREVHRSKRVAPQKIAQQKVVQQKLVRVAVRSAKVCTGNWVNATCAAP
jgi:hypothetical protein